MKNITIDGIEYTLTPKEVKESDIGIYLASNDCPPEWVFKEDLSYLNTSREAILKMKQIEDWKYTRFTFCTPVGGNVNEFVPLSEDDKDLCAADFKYIIKIV